MDEDQICELKRKINEFIWQNSPGDMTLARAEQAAVALLSAMIPGSVPDAGDRDLCQTQVIRNE